MGTKTTSTGALTLDVIATTPRTAKSFHRTLTLKPGLLLILTGSTLTLLSLTSLITARPSTSSATDRTLTARSLLLLSDQLVSIYSDFSIAINQTNRYY